MFDPLFLILLLMIGPGLILLVAIVIAFAVREKSAGEWTRRAGRSGRIVRYLRRDLDA